MNEASLTGALEHLGPIFGFLFVALVVAVMVALLVVGGWGVIKGARGVRAREPQPATS